jgi:hypothetical protein
MHSWTILVRIYGRYQHPQKVEIFDMAILGFSKKSKPKIRGITLVKEIASWLYHVAYTRHTHLYTVAILGGLHMYLGSPRSKLLSWRLVQCSEDTVRHPRRNLYTRRGHPGVWVTTVSMPQATALDSQEGWMFCEQSVMTVWVVHACSCVIRNYSYSLWSRD